MGQHGLLLGSTRVRLQAPGGPAYRRRGGDPDPLGGHSSEPTGGVPRPTLFFKILLGLLDYGRRAGGGSRLHIGEAPLTAAIQPCGAPRRRCFTRSFPGSANLSSPCLSSGPLYAAAPFRRVSTSSPSPGPSTGGAAGHGSCAPIAAVPPAGWCGSRAGGPRRRNKGQAPGRWR
jgi:hypothetical protein